MKKIYLLGILIILAVIFASGCVSNSNSSNGNNTTEPQTLTQNGVSIVFPGDWVSANSESNDTIIAVADPSSKDADGFNDVNVNVEVKNSSSSLNSEFTSAYNQLNSNSDYQLMTEGNVTAAGTDAMEADYTSTVNGTTKQHKAIWIKKDNQIYVILCTAPQDKYASEEANFNFIIDNFKFA